MKLQNAYNRRFDQTNNHQVHLEENPRRTIDNGDKSYLLDMDYQSVGLPRRAVQRHYREFYSENFEQEFRPICVKRPADFSGMPHRYDRGITDFGPRPPVFEGKSDTWEPFFMQFNLLAQRFNWSEHEYCDQLLFAPKGDALMYVSNLSITVRDNTTLLIQTLAQRFGQCHLASTHCTSMYTVRKNSKVSVQQYTAYISNLMCRAYPGMEGTPIFSN